MVAQPLYAETGDEVTDLVDRLRMADGEEVTLVLPRGSAVAQSLVNLKLLRREAEKLGLSLSLVASDPIIRHLATEAGLTSHGELPVLSEPSLTSDEAATSTPDAVRIPGDFSMRSVAEDVSEEPIASSSKNREAPAPVSISSLPDATDTHPVPIRSVVRELPAYASEEEEATAPWVADVMPTASEEASKPVRHAREPASNNVRSAPAVRLRDAVGKRPPRVSLLPRVTKLVFGFVLVAGLAAGGAVMAWVLPKATVTVAPRQEPFSADVEAVLAASTDATDSVTGTVPAVPLSAEVTSERRTFPATGVSTAGGGKARGSVVITNAYTANPQTLVATTRFLTPDNKLYRLRETIVVPGLTTTAAGKETPGKLTAEVEADQIGAVYNISSTSFTIPGLAPDPRAKITAKTSTSFVGGADAGNGKKTISQQDMDTAVQQLEHDALVSAADALKAKVALGETVLPEAVHTEVLERRSSGDVGDAQDEFSLELHVAARSLAFREEDLRSVLFSSLTPLLPKGETFTDKTLEGFTFKTLSYDTSKESLRLQAHYERPVLALLPTEDITSSLAGKSAEEVQNLLIDKYQVASAQVAFWPFWVEHVPRLPGKVSLVLDTKAGSQ